MNSILFLIISLVILISALAVMFVVFLRSFLGFIFWGAIYVPSRKDRIDKIIELAEIKPGEKAVDLGSGDGRLVIALAKAGAEAYGYEIDPTLVRSSKKNIQEAGLKAFIEWGSFWQADLSQFDVVVIYGMSHVMKRLEKKLGKELRKGTRVICNSFEFPNWSCKKKENNVYLYQV